VELRRDLRNRAGTVAGIVNPRTRNRTSRILKKTGKYLAPPLAAYRAQGVAQQHQNFMMSVLLSVLPVERPFRVHGSDAPVGLGSYERWSWKAEDLGLACPPAKGKALEITW
jgi:hypothetical protein